MKAPYRSRATPDWDAALHGWRETRGNLLLRSYSDCVNAALLEAWTPNLDGARVLKTDLFDEAVSHGLYPMLRAKGAVVSAVDVSPAVLAAARKRYPDLHAEQADLRRLRYAAKRSTSLSRTPPSTTSTTSTSCSESSRNCTASSGRALVSLPQRELALTRQQEAPGGHRFTRLPWKGGRS